MFAYFHGHYLLIKIWGLTISWLEFLVFYGFVALVFFIYLFGKKFNFKEYLNYLLPAEIRNKTSFRLDVYWFLLSLIKIPSLFLKVLSTILMLHYVPVLLNSSSIHELSAIRQMDLWLATTNYRSLIIFLVAFLAFDFGAYWAHRLVHKISILWQFHKVHHYGEQLNYFSGGRTHPIDGFITFNFAVLCMACALSFIGPIEPSIFNGYSGYAKAGDYYYYALIFLPSFFNRLNHSHFPLSYGPIFGRIFVSPSFHTIHHSKIIINRNFGSFFSIWDSLFGTSYLPKNVSDSIESHKQLGVNGMGDNYYSNILQWLYRPFIDAYKLIIKKYRLREDIKPTHG